MALGELLNRRGTTMAEAALLLPLVQSYATWSWILESLAGVEWLVSRHAKSGFIPLMIMRKACLMCITWAFGWAY